MELFLVILILEDFISSNLLDDKFKELEIVEIGEI